MTTTWRRRTVRAAVVVLVVPVVASLLSFASSLVPDRLILDALVDGVDDRQILNVPQVGISGRGLDVFSDCIAITMGLGDSDGGAGTVWLRSPTLGSCAGAIPSIERYRDGAGLSGGYEYFRYWHGYTIASRPLLATVGVAGTRITLFWLHLGVVALLARRLWRYHGVVAPAALLVPFLLTTDTLELARSVPHGFASIVAIAGALAVHIVSARSNELPPTRDGDLAVASTAFLAGAAYVFVDVLTTPSGVWALTVAVAMLAVVRDRDALGVLARGGLVGGAWIAGWVWTWVTKWGLTASVLGLDRVRSSIGEAIEDRIAGERDYIDLAPFRAIEDNVRVWWEHPFAPLVVVVIIVAAIVRFARPDHRAALTTRLALAAPAAIPLVWFEVLRNHSLVHVLFVYRSLGASAGIVALALLIPSEEIGRDAGSPDAPGPERSPVSAPG